MPSTVLNSTNLRTDDLERFVNAALANECENRGFLFAMDYGDNGFLRGAVLGDTPFVFLEVPQSFPERGLTCLHLKELGQVIIHELGHTYGLTDEEIPALAKLNTEWVHGLQLRRRKRRKKRRIT